jgi:hypothetical protein
MVVYSDRLAWESYLPALAWPCRLLRHCPIQGYLFMVQASSPDATAGFTYHSLSSIMRSRLTNPITRSRIALCPSSTCEHHHKPTRQTISPCLLGFEPPTYLLCLITRLPNKVPLDWNLAKKKTLADIIQSFLRQSILCSPIIPPSPIGSVSCTSAFAPSIHQPEFKLAAPNDRPTLQPRLHR